MSHSCAIYDVYLTDLMMMLSIGVTAVTGCAGHKHMELKGYTMRWSSFMFAMW